MTEQTITTAAVGQTSAPPDEVGLQFSASAIEPDVTSARRAVAAQATRLRQVLDTTGVPEERIRTSRFHIRKRTPNRSEQPTQDPRPYEATERIIVTLFDLDRLGDVLTAAVDEAGVEINEVAFTFQTETRRELQREAIADAVTAARKKATAAADAESLTIDGVRSMVTDDAAQPRRTSAGSQLIRDTAEQESGSVESGPVDVHARVEVEYWLTET